MYWFWLNYVNAICVQVCVQHRESAYLAVTPVVNLPELEKFSTRLQTEAEEAAPLSPAITKCLALCPVTNRWSVSPEHFLIFYILKVKWLDWSGELSCIRLWPISKTNVKMLESLLHHKSCKVLNHFNYI